MVALKTVYSAASATYSSLERTDLDAIVVVSLNTASLP